MQTVRFLFAADLKVSKYADQVSCERTDCSRSNEQETDGENRVVLRSSNSLY